MPFRTVQIDRLADPNGVVDLESEDSAPASKPQIPKTPDEQSRSQTSEHPDVAVDEQRPRIGTKK